MYCVPMITTGELFQNFIFYATHQIRTKNCKKIIFHEVVSWKKVKKRSTILVVRCLRHIFSCGWPDPVWYVPARHCVQTPEPAHAQPSGDDLISILLSFDVYSRMLYCRAATATSLVVPGSQVLQVDPDPMLWYSKTMRKITKARAFRSKHIGPDTNK